MPPGGSTNLSSETLSVRMVLVKLFAPDVAYVDAPNASPPCWRISELGQMRVLRCWTHSKRVVKPIDVERCLGMSQQALQRIEIRDADDGLVVACATTIGCRCALKTPIFSVQV